MDILEYSALDLGQRIRAGEISPVEAARAAVDAAKRDEHNAYISVDEVGALRQAEAVQEALGRGEELSPLAGVPIAVKDNIAMENRRLTCGSRMLENFVSPYDATVVEKLRAAGVVVIGKTNLDEFAMGSTNETSYFGPVKNPWDKKRVPGGSSGGSAAAVAARSVFAALGSDTGGSIRQPCAFCGTTGLKPTYGAVSRYGLVAHASSLDQIGPIARNARDAGALFGVIAGKDSRDGTSMGVDFSVPVDGNIRGKRIGIPVSYFDKGLEPHVKEAVLNAAETFRELGATLVDLDMRTVDYAIPAYYIVSAAEASSNLSRFDGVKYGYRAREYQDLYDLYVSSRTEGFGAEVKRRIMLGSFVLSSGYYDAYYKRAMQVRAVIKREFDDALQKCDMILSPTSPITAPLMNQKQEDPLKIRMMDIYTVSINLCGLPGLALPCGFDDLNLPIGMQLIGPAFSDRMLLGVGESYQAVTDFHTRFPREEA